MLALQNPACGQIMKPINQFFFSYCVAQGHIAIVKTWLDFYEINFLQLKPESQQYSINVDKQKNMNKIFL